MDFIVQDVSSLTRLLIWFRYKISEYRFKRDGSQGSSANLYDITDNKRTYLTNNRNKKVIKTIIETPNNLEISNIQNISLKILIKLLIIQSISLKILTIQLSTHNT